MSYPYPEAAQEDRTPTRMPGQLGAKPGLQSKLELLFSFPAVLVAGLVVVTVLTISNRFNDPDLWWHLKVGEIIASTHSIPTTEIFSHTAQGHSWTAHEWLAQLSIYEAYKAGGNTGLMLWLSVLSSLLVVSVFVFCYRSFGNALVAFLAALCVWFFGTVGLAIRPLVPGHLFLVIELVLLTVGARKRSWLWLLPPLFAVWVNTHGSYFFGLGILFVYFLCGFVGVNISGLIVSEKSSKEERRFGAVILGLCAVALCCNPVGIHLLLYPLDTLFKQSTGLSSSQEWLPPDLLDGRTLSMIALAAGIPIIALLRRVALPLRDVLFALMALGLAVQHSRMLFIFGIFISPLFCRVVAPLLLENRKREHPIANAVLIAGCVMAIVSWFPSPAGLEEQVRKANPIGAIDYIRKAGLSGPMLNDYGFGGYLIWALPEHKVFIDGRGDVYDWTGVFKEYGRWATLSEDPTLLLDKYRIQFCVLPKSGPLAQVVGYLPGWRKAYSDQLAVVFVR